MESLNQQWKTIVAFIGSRTGEMSASERKEYLDFVAVFIGTSRKTLDRWIIASELPRTIKNSEVRRKNIERLYKFVSQQSEGNWKLAVAFGDALKLRNEEFGVLGNYKGEYESFRLGKDGLIRGDVEITNESGAEPWMHYHRSSQDDIHYSHSGPVYHVNGRLYVVGVGTGEADKYFRPMILRAKDQPHKSVTFGIVLTELAHEYTPLAAKVALVSKADPRLKDEKFLSDLEARLKINSDFNVIYGTGDLSI